MKPSLAKTHVPNQEGTHENAQEEATTITSWESDYMGALWPVL